MLGMEKYLAIDIGASSGRHILGWKQDGKIRLEEVYRFPNGLVRKDGHDCWDLEKLYASVREGIAAAKAKGPVASAGIDTWGVDFTLLGKDGKPCCDSVSYRDGRTAGADAEIERDVISFADLYSRCGIQKTPFNTIYQLWALKKEHPEQLERAERFLTVPEYLTYRLTGEIVHEYTDSSTTSLLDAAAKDWDRELIKRLGLPEGIFGRLEMPGAAAGTCDGVRVVLPAMHDTGSAYLAVPARDDKAVYLSSGTWSLLGVENEAPILTPESREANFTNEGGAWGRYRYLKNIMGLWMIQSLRRELNGESYVEGADAGASEAALSRLRDRRPGGGYTFGDLSALAAESKETPATIDVNETRFMNPRSMAAETMAAAAERGTPPETVGGLLKCVYSSLASCYARSIGDLSRLTGKTYTSLNIVGGGCRDAYLNSLVAEATGLEVFTGPVEGTAIGNLIVQMIAAGEFKDLAEARAAIER